MKNADKLRGLADMTFREMATTLSNMNLCCNKGIQCGNTNCETCWYWYLCEEKES